MRRRTILVGVSPLVPNGMCWDGDPKITHTDSLSS